MNAFASLLVPVDATARSETHLRLALQLAALGSGGKQPCAIEALYCTAPSFADLPMAYAEGAAASLPYLESLYARRRARAREAFERVQADAATPVRWLELGVQPLLETLAGRALFADLLVLGQYQPDDMEAVTRPPDCVESLLIASGKPALVLPYAGQFPTVGRRVLLAWKPTREAARAVAAALPLLRRAARIHLLIEAERSADAPATRADLLAYLQQHGVDAPLEVHPALETSAVGEALLSKAAEIDADLLVMGCYGHSRARELVLGGASRTVLRAMTLPVLMAH
ncbi:MAG: universal stress protein [Burkholderiaceae bacterium]